MVVEIDRIILVPEITERIPGYLFELAFSRRWVHRAFALRAADGMLERHDPPSVVVRAVEDEGLRLANTSGSGGNSGTWRAVHNGRWALEFDATALTRAMVQRPASVLVVTADEKLAAYREKLLCSNEGAVFGFRRSYTSEVTPASLTEEWPQLLLFGPEVPLKDATLSCSSFPDLVARLAQIGAEIVPLAVGGRAWDLACPEGILCWMREFLLANGPAPAVTTAVGAWVSSEASVAGNVIIEEGVTVEPGAVIIGPVFAAEGSRIGRGAVVRSSILGPGSVVKAGRVVCGEVLVEGLPAGGVGGGRLERHRVRGDGRAGGFRTWPFLSYARFGKRVFDVIASVTALLLLVLVFPLIAVAIKLNSRGPVFYRHRRQGRHGKEFMCLKFRTMIVEAEEVHDQLQAMNEVDGPQFKVTDDPRVTIVGEFLRQTNLDELPQFFNVLAGQMSLVGPRPSPDEENQMCPWWREARLSVRPGITGLWQVSRSPDRKNDFQEWIYYDTEYARRISFRLDLAIVFRTFKVFFEEFLRLFERRAREGEGAVS